MLEPKSFDVYKNTTVSMIVILGCLEIDIEVLDIDIETVESNECRRVSRDDRDTNGVLAIMWEEARVSYKDE